MWTCPQERDPRRCRSLPTAALAGVVAMLTAGMFEYNFGDSEFLMLFLLLVTLPYAADRVPARTPAVDRATARRLRWPARRLLDHGSPAASC